MAHQTPKSDKASDPVTAIAELTNRLITERQGPSVWSADFTSDNQGQVVTVLLEPANPNIDAAIKAYAQRWRCDRRAAASQLWKAYSYWLTLPALVGWVALRQVPDLAAEMVTARFTDTPPYVAFGLNTQRVAVRDDDITAEHPQTVIAVSDHELLEFMLHRLLDDHLVPALQAFREHSGVGNRILWGSVAMAFTHPFFALSSYLDRDLTAELDQICTAIGPVSKLVEMAETRYDDGRRAPRPLRLTCCQKMRIPGQANCLSCPLLSPKRRRQRAAALGFTWIRHSIATTPPA